MPSCYWLPLLVIHFTQSRYKIQNIRPYFNLFHSLEPQRIFLLTISKSIYPIVSMKAISAPVFDLIMLTLRDLKTYNYSFFVKHPAIVAGIGRNIRK
jgi:hypothetical protein